MQAQNAGALHGWRALHAPLLKTRRAKNRARAIPRPDARAWGLEGENSG
jgi:hypothetical protein